MNSSPLFEGPALDAWQSWFGDRPVVGAGPVDYEIVDYSKDKSPDTLKIINFLDSALEKYGANSVIYVGFCSNTSFLPTILRLPNIAFIRFHVVVYGARENMGSH